MALLGGHARKKKKPKSCTATFNFVWENRAHFSLQCSLLYCIICTSKNSLYFSKAGASKVGSCTPASVQDDPLGSGEKR